MRSRRAVEPFEPILIEERGKGRLAELRLPQDAEQRSGSLVLLAREEDERRRSFGGSTSTVSGPGPSPKSTRRRRSGGASTKWAISCRMT